MADENLYPKILTYEKLSEDSPYIITEQKNNQDDEKEIVKFERHVNSLGVSVKSLKHRVDYKTTEELTKDYKSTGNFVASTRHRLTGEGVLERGDFQPDTISIFGGDNKTSKIGIEIHVRPDELSNDVFTFTGFKEIQSYDISSDEAFFLSLYLSSERFHEIAELVQTGNLEAIYINFDAGSLKRIFVQPSYFNEREDYKYLVNIKDIENKDAVPEDFLKREDNAEFELTITKRKGFSNVEHQNLQREEDDDLASVPQDAHSDLPPYKTKTREAQKSSVEAANAKWLARLVYSIWIIALIFLVFK